MRRKHDAQELAAVRSAALVGFEVIQPIPPDIMGELFLGSNKAEERNLPMSGMNFAGMIAKPSPHARALYDDAVKSLATELGWKFSSAALIQKNSYYKELLKEWMGPVQSKTPIREGETKFHAPELLDYDSVQRLKQNERDQLMQGLGVDAIAAIKVRTIIHSATVMGIGNRYPQAVLEFRLYRKGVKDQIWYDVNAEGLRSKESMGVTRITSDFEKMNKLLAESAKSAYRQLVANTKQTQ